MTKNFDLTLTLKEVKYRFQIPEKTQALPQEWDGLTLDIHISRKTNERPIECLEMVITALSGIQSSFPKEYLNDIILRIELLSVV